MKDDFSIVGFLKALKEANDTGFFPPEFKYTPVQAKETLREVRQELVNVRQITERCDEDPRELMDRVKNSLALIEQDYPEETKFLNIIVTQKIAPEEFYQQAMSLMCDISNAQSGLLSTQQTVITLGNYLKLIQLIRSDEALKAEAARISQESFTHAAGIAK